MPDTPGKYPDRLHEMYTPGERPFSVSTLRKPAATESSAHHVAVHLLECATQGVALIRVWGLLRITVAPSNAYLTGDQVSVAIKKVDTNLPGI